METPKHCCRNGICHLCRNFLEVKKHEILIHEEMEELLCQGEEDAKKIEEKNKKQDLDSN